MLDAERAAHGAACANYDRLLRMKLGSFPQVGRSSRCVGEWAAWSLLAGQSPGVSARLGPARRHASIRCRHGDPPGQRVMLAGINPIDFAPAARRLLRHLAAATITSLTDIIIVEHLVDSQGEHLPPLRASLFHGARFAYHTRRLNPDHMRECAAGWITRMVPSTPHGPVVPVEGDGRRTMGRVIGYSLEFVELLDT